MKKKLFILILISLFLLPARSVWAFWIWTPETNRWTNPKYAVKDTPGDQLTYALEFYEKEEYSKAIKELKRLVKSYPKAKEVADAQYYIGRTLEAKDKPYEAFKAYQVVVEKYPFSDRAVEIIDRQYEIGNQLLKGGPRRSKIVQTFVGGDYDVLDVYRTVIKNAPYGKNAAPAQYKIGLYLQEKQMFQEARDEFEKVINDYSDTEWAQAAKYQIALADASRSSGAQYDQKVTQSAVSEFKEFVKNYPDAGLSKEAQQRIAELREKEAENNFVVARFYEKQKKYKAARIYYNAVVEEFYQTTWAPKALEKVRELDYILNDD